MLEAVLKELYQEISVDSTLPSEGSILRRIGQGKDQQGRYIKHTEDGQAWVIAEVLDLAEGRFLAEGGIIRKTDQDTIYASQSLFGNDSKSEAAQNVLLSWSLYAKHPALQSEMRRFVAASFLPAQILLWKKEDDLRKLFVPIQERFKIGKYAEKVDYDKLRMERFRKQLSALTDGKHLTYVAFIPRDTTHEPMFFSIGTKPHLETRKVLLEGEFAFHPNHGGHIKCAMDTDESSTLLVDAGSNDLGAGIHTSLATAEMVVESLKSLYPEFRYKPLAGRGAFGIQQSY